MKRPGIHLQYRFEADGQEGAEIDNPLFDVLAAVQEHGSIRHAATALGRSYRHTWGDLKHWEQVLQQPLVEWAQGKRAKLTAFGQRVLWAERQARVRMRPHIEGLRAELQHALALASDPRLEVLEVFASHDLALPKLQSIASTEQLQLGLRFVGSEEALRHLNSGRCNVAGFHVPRLPELMDPSQPTTFAAALRPLLQPGLHKLIGAHSRMQGLMLRKGQPMPADLRDVARMQLRFVNRQQGSGTRLLCEHLLRAAHIDPHAVVGYHTLSEDTHVALAAAIASDAADVGLGVEAAAREFGLAFVPLVEEDYYLVCLREALHTLALARLRNSLSSAAWGTTLQSLGGYRAQRSGEILSLTQALPWWTYAKRKSARAHAV
jgi:putative molybdopterin biosynthesis protein